ncbi:hypothetical protein [Chitinolyticbacter albus]|uniref:hypothetical protein n=1 Tax=Chitinolyticbacter albus TaxID=2961951 RepID=UPI00210CFBF0|nr:hypothetical protein [Chitinolyticbacter albus]
MRRTPALLVFAALSMFAIAGDSPLRMPSATLSSLLQYVDASDGISRSEANEIAEAYFLQHVGCGHYSGLAETPGILDC